MKNVVVDDDGCSFLCLGCGKKVWRSRDNPFPDVKHTKKCPVRIQELKRKMGYENPSELEQAKILYQAILENDLDGKIAKIGPKLP